MTIERLNTMLGTNFVLVDRKGMPNKSNIDIMKRLADITEAEVKRFMAEDEEFNMTPRPRGYHALRALDRWYKKNGHKGGDDGTGRGDRDGKDFGGGSGGMDGRDGERKPDGSGSGKGDGSGDGDGNPKDGKGGDSKGDGSGEADGDGNGEGKGDGNGDGEAKDGNGNGDSKEGNGNGGDGKDEPKDDGKKDGEGDGDEMKPPKDEKKDDGKKDEPLTDIEELIDAVITIPRDDGTPENLYLWGDSGTGKSFGVKEVCRKKGYEYFETGKVDMPERLIGYGTADGGYYVPAFLRKAIEGPEDPNTEILVMNADEFDSNPNAVTLALNNLYASRVLATPQGVYKVHPKVRFVATGNTTMDGSDEKFERETVDKSVKTRWFFHEVGYDPKVEKKLADRETVKFLQQLREAKEEIGLDLMVTYREFTRLAWSEKLIAKGILTREKALDDCLFKGMTEDDRLALRKDPKMVKLIDKNNKWAVEM